MKGMLYELTFMKCFDLIYNSNTGATSFENLRTFKGHIHDIFKEACCARGLLEDDEEWLRCLRDASEIKTGQQLQSLFVMILLHCNPVDPHHLWVDTKGHLCDDLQYQLIHCLHMPDL